MRIVKTNLGEKKRAGRLTRGAEGSAAPPRRATFAARGNT